MVALILGAAEPGALVYLSGLIITGLFGGGVVAFFKVRPENERTLAQAAKEGAEVGVISVDRQKLMDEMQANVLASVKQDYDEMARRLDKAVVELAQERRRGAEKDLKIEIMGRKIEQLMDEAGALRAQLGLHERRINGDS